MEEPVSAFAIYKARAPIEAARKLKNKKKREKRIAKSVARINSNSSISSSSEKKKPKRKNKKSPIKSSSNSDATPEKKLTVLKSEKRKLFDDGIDDFGPVPPKLKKSMKKILKDENLKTPIVIKAEEINGVLDENIKTPILVKTEEINGVSDKNIKTPFVANTEDTNGVSVDRNISNFEQSLIIENLMRSNKCKLDNSALRTGRKKQQKTALIAQLSETPRDQESPIPILVPIETQKSRVKKNIMKKNQNYSSDSSFNSHASINNGSSESNKMLKWLLAPMDLNEFFTVTWENNPLHVKRLNRSYFTHILSTAGVDEILRKNSLHYGKNVDVVTYTDGKRETHNLEGRAVPATVWDFYSNGCSIRILNPQTYCKKLHKIIAALQETFGCMVGANLYLTPPNSQGFAPHYDDIEAFVIQLEGKKRWKLYNPLNENEVLPKYSSRNFTQDEIGQPIMDITLKAGELLYFPRGIIHQAQTSPDNHSLHITISTYQKTTYSDLIQKMLPEMLKVATLNNVKFRKGLPLQYLRYAGIVNSDNTCRERVSFLSTVQKLLIGMVKYAQIDIAVDELGKQFMHDAMPPTYTGEEKIRSIQEDGERMSDGKVYNRGEIGLDTKVRLLRYHAIRLVSEENTLRIYHCIDNSLEYHGLDMQYLEIDVVFAPAVEKLQKYYPNFISVEELPLETDSDKMQIIGDLWERGIIITEEPLDIPVSEVGSDDDRE